MSDLPPPPRIFRIETRKIVDYLLNIRHPDGGSKARFFLSHGFSPVDARQFAIRMLDHPLPENSDMTGVVRDAYALKYVYDGKLVCPDGSTPRVRSVWEVRANEVHGRLVTAYPLPGRRTPPSS